MTRRKTPSSVADQAKAARRVAWAEKVEAMRRGVRLRPQTYRSGTEYRRKPKHPPN